LSLIEWKMRWTRALRSKSVNTDSPKTDQYKSAHRLE